LCLGPYSVDLSCSALSRRFCIECVAGFSRAPLRRTKVIGSKPPPIISAAIVHPLIEPSSGACPKSNSWAPAQLAAPVHSFALFLDQTKGGQPTARVPLWRNCKSGNI